MTKSPSKTVAQKTKTQPDSERDGFFEGPDPVNWIHIVGTGQSLRLPDKRAFKLGSSSKNDIVIKREYISRHHCTLTRTYDGLLVEDTSKNGTWVDHRATSNAPREIRPGETFVVDTITFLALNDAMYAAFPTLNEILDWETGDPFPPSESDWPSPSAVTMWGAGHQHLLIVAMRGCGQERLLETIHAISPMRGKAPIVVEDIPADRAEQRDLLLRAQKTSMLLAITDDTKPFDSMFSSMLFSPSYRIRVLARAPSIECAQRVLGRECAAMRRIDLRPLAFRIDQLPRLLDRQFERLETTLRFDQIAPENQAALMANEWRRNLDEVVLAAPKLVAVATSGSLRKAAPALGIKNYNNLQSWYSNTMKLKLPLTK
ncbi:MAG: FHA domain-containing protein [Kofleriaceae bacterium]